jgi:hypothetical protein
MKAARVVYLRLPEDMKSESGLSLWAGETWYAMNELPKGK